VKDNRTPGRSSAIIATVCLFPFGEL